MVSLSLLSVFGTAAEPPPRLSDLGANIWVKLSPLEDGAPSPRMGYEGACVWDRWHQLLRGRTSGRRIAAAADRASHFRPGRDCLGPCDGPDRDRLGTSPAFLTIPSSPQHVFGREEGETCALRWKPNPEKGIQGYRIYRMDGRYDSDPVSRLTDVPMK